MGQRVFAVEGENAGQRIDRFLAGEGTGLTRSALQDLIAGGHVQANGCMISGCLEEVIDKLRYTIKQHLQD